ncbi:MAG: hypothetical protein II144_01220 [Paludibacteraceae bacterium]|nr:hypothetical protein [Paludibacteraceae bacterium]
MKNRFLILLLFCANISFAQPRTEDIILDIYTQLTELGEVDYETLQEELLEIAEQPIDLNSATQNDLERLHFLSPRQIDDILSYVYRHPMDSLYELQLIGSLTDYDIRNLCAFVRLVPVQTETSRIYFREALQQLKHEITTRVDVRNAENFAADPVYVQTRYKMHYRDQFDMNLQLRRPTGGDAQSLQYGGYLRLRNVGALQSLVVGNLQASFGQGLVLSSPFHMGRSAYVDNISTEPEGVRALSSVDGSGLHGLGATTRWQVGKVHFNASALYSIKHEKDTIWHHTIGANLTAMGQNWKVGITAVENFYSDSIHPYQNTQYNQHYFRGRQQAVVGINGRYRWRWLDLFGEVATAQNKQWGIGVQAGARFAASNKTDLTLLYRFYSPWFDNALGYGFSETSRIGDEQGIYLGFDIRELSRWQFRGYADLFRFSGIKYGIHYAPSYGYDAMLETAYIPNQVWNVRWRVRAREKAQKGHYSFRAGFSWQRGGWRLATTAEANLTQDSLRQRGWGLSLAQDIAYSWQQIPLTLQLRLQGFDARAWDNRIYLYENDVLYAISTPATYGRGGRAYLNLRWRIIDQLSLYFKISETVFEKTWAAAHSRPQTRTDIHLLLRATLP